MKKLLIIMASVALKMTALSANGSPAATQSWVTNKIYQSVRSTIMTQCHTNNAWHFIADGFHAYKEDPIIPALLARDATDAAISYGVTNGMYFVWNESTHSYTNYTQTIEATKTNFVWRGYQSVGLKFDGYFDVKLMLIQPKFAEEVVK